MKSGRPRKLSEYQRKALKRRANGETLVSIATNPRKPRLMKVREHLGKWVRELGLTDPEVKSNHASRDTFKQIGHRYDISERILDAIAGHAPVSIGRGYGLPTLADMAAALKKFPRYEVE